VDIEATGYGGATTGAWACGPTARANYGGIGAEVTVHAHPEIRSDSEVVLHEDEGTEKTGLALSLGATAERRVFTILQCGGKFTQCAVPPAGVAYAGAAKLGWDFPEGGFRVGLLMWQNWGSPTDTTPGTAWLPDAQFWAGSMHSLRFEMGGGAYGPMTYLRPGAWVGFVGVPREGWEIGLRGTECVSGVGAGGGPRGDLTLAVPVTSALQVGVGGALSESLSGYLEPEGHLSLLVHVR
jgi:hypothetical protein